MKQIIFPTLMGLACAGLFTSCSKKDTVSAPAVIAVQPNPTASLLTRMQEVEDTTEWTSFEYNNQSQLVRVNEPQRYYTIERNGNSVILRFFKPVSNQSLGTLTGKLNEQGLIVSMAGTLASGNANVEIKFTSEYNNSKQLIKSTKHYVYPNNTFSYSMEYIWEGDNMVKEKFFDQGVFAYERVYSYDHNHVNKLESFHSIPYSTPAGMQGAVNKNPSVGHQQIMPDGTVKSKTKTDWTWDAAGRPLTSKTTNLLKNSFYTVKYSF